MFRMVHKLKACKQMCKKSSLDHKQSRFEGWNTNVTKALDAQNALFQHGLVELNHIDPALTSSDKETRMHMQQYLQDLGR